MTCLLLIHVPFDSFIHMCRTKILSTLCFKDRHQSTQHLSNVNAVIWHILFCPRLPASRDRLILHEAWIPWIKHPRLQVTCCYLLPHWHVQTLFWTSNNIMPRRMLNEQSDKKYNMVVNLKCHICLPLLSWYRLHYPGVSFSHNVTTSVYSPSRSCLCLSSGTYLFAIVGSLYSYALHG